MKAVLFILFGVIIFVTFMFISLFFGMRAAHARVRFEKIRRELKEHGRYQEWANANKMLLLSRTLVITGALTGLPVFLLFDWLGYRQIGVVFLGIFVFCLLAVWPVNWILYNKIYQDLD